MSNDSAWLSCAPRESFLVDGIEVRRYRHTDAPALVRAVTESIEHLRPWMPWTRFEPQSVAQRESLIGQWNEEWDRLQGFGYGCFVGDALVGSCGLHLRSRPGILEIGYWVHVAHTGRGVATSVSRGLTTVAFEIAETDAVEVVHDPANVASGRVPEKLGFTHVEDFDRGMSGGSNPDAAPGESGTGRRWRLTRSEWTAIVG